MYIYYLLSPVVGPAVGAWSRIIIKGTGDVHPTCIVEDDPFNDVGRLPHLKFKPTEPYQGSHVYH